MTVAYLTGQSAPGCNALTAGQRRFLEESPVAEGEWLPVNFPYGPRVEPARPPGLVAASVSNSLQYLRSRGETFREVHRERFLDTFSASRRVILLAGSCGLELFCNLSLPDEFLRRCHVFAYGPVSRSVPRCHTLWRVRGRKDIISRYWHPRVDHLVPCHHMNYLECPRTAELFREFYHLVRHADVTT